MKIDTHQHYWHYRAREFAWISEDMPVLRRDCLPQDVAACMATTQVTGVVAVQARSLVEETDFLLQLADVHAPILGVVGWADLHGDGVAQYLQRWCQHPKFKGLRHILQDEADVLAWVQSPLVNTQLRNLQQLGKTYDVLVFEHQMADVLQFCAHHDRHWLVLDHLGKPRLRDDARERRSWQQQLHQFAQLPHVMCKLSGLVTETGAHQRSVAGWPAPQEAMLWACFDAALQAFGPQRLMFGSDWPVCQLAAPFERVHDVVQAWAQARLSAAEQADFWHRNAERCYALAPSGSPP